MPREHAACGVGLRVNLAKKSSHQTVINGLDDLKKMGYRAAENEVTSESDGVGIKLYGIPVDFFNQKIIEGEFITANAKPLQAHTLKSNQFVIGQYFLSNDLQQQTDAKKLIEETAKQNGLRVIGWRDLNNENATDISILSEKALEKKPSMWQAILEPESFTTIADLEMAAMKTTGHINYEARKQNISLNVISQSAEAIIYKGMVRAEELEIFFRDLLHPLFTALAAIVHSRFATNTDPQWPNAQPFEHWAHNGEKNSLPTNIADMRAQLDAQQFKGIYPNAKLSDSAHVSADLGNQMVMKNISLMEAFARLLPPFESSDFSDEANAMLRYFQLERRPYNGPAFGVAGHGGYFIAKLDVAALRPSRFTIIEHANGEREFIAASDDFVDVPPNGKIIQKGHLEGGSMVVITPEGKMLNTSEVLDLISAQYHEKFENKNYFQDQLKNILNPPLTPQVNEPAFNTEELNRTLYEAGWDQESAEAVRYMAMNGSEKVGAMGDDTNPLHVEGTPGHISYFFHQLFAQVTAPPQDSVHEPENFSLKTTLGPMVGAFPQVKQIPLDSPILADGYMSALIAQKEVPVTVLNTAFDLSTTSLAEAIQQLLLKAEAAAKSGGVLVLSDSSIESHQTLIPDVIAVAAVRRYLEHKNLSRQVSIVADSYQISGPHHAAVLFSLGAQAVYPRGAYEKIKDSKEGSVDKYRQALDKCLLKTMGKIGIHDVNAYINGSFVSALGIDLSLDPMLSKIFPGIYSPLKGINLNHIAQGLNIRHHQAQDKDIDFTRLPHSGYFMPEKNGLQHGFGPKVITAFTQWLKDEDIRGQLKRLDTLLDAKGVKGYANDAFSLETGFLDPSKKDKDGFYHPNELEQFKPSPSFEKLIETIDAYRKANPTALHDYFDVKAPAPIHQTKTATPLQSQAEIRKRLFAGSMSQGALTVANPDTPEKLGAHEALTRGMNAIGAKSASGEGGEAPMDLRTPLKSSRSKQVASGRFGVNVMQIISAADSDGEIEIKVAQGAKPGEGGQLPGFKVSVRFAAQRNVLPGTPCISPPPHHDIYSIEDLTQLIESIKAVKPHVKVAVKLVASPGIGTIAVGVAKAGADVINIAGHSGGTGAAQLSSIKHAGWPSELGLVEVDKALRKTKLRNLVQLRTSGGFKTPEDIIVAAILGADLFELGTTAMLTMRCKMQRTCNVSCQPGVAADGHLFKGDQINVERFFVNLAAGVQKRLKELGVNSLEELKGRTDLLALHDPSMSDRYDFSSLLTQDKTPQPSEDIIQTVQKKRQMRIADIKEQALIEKIHLFFAQNPKGTFISETVMLTTTNRVFGTRIAGEFAKHLEQYPDAKIILNSKGFAGQSMAFVLPKGMEIHHEGSVQDGVAKSMSGGVVALKTPTQQAQYHAHENTLAGNAIAYGASGGKLFINGRVGHRLGILSKGAEIVVEGAGNLAFPYMTEGTGMILGTVGKGLCSSAMGGIVFVYDEKNKVQASDAVRVADKTESTPYTQAIKSLLQEHFDQTQSQRAKSILEKFDPTHFKVLIPKALDNIATIDDLINVLKMYQLRESPISRGMHIWLSQKIITIVEGQKKIIQNGQLDQLQALISKMPELSALSRLFETQRKGESNRESTDSSPVMVSSDGLVHIHPRTSRSVQDRLGSVNGVLDELLWDALSNISQYVGALSHDAQGCSGCLAQSCAGGEEVKTGCPSGKQINSINATLKKLGKLIPGQQLSAQQWNILREAFFLQTRESPFISYTGAACTAPCQDACTETIPDGGKPNPKRDYKPTGEHVHIKDIEYYLYHVGRAMGWFDGKKQFTVAEVKQLFGTETAKEAYDQAMQRFVPLFVKPNTIHLHKELVIVGSGPAAMQIAFEALRDGIKVRMYEKSDKPGGLLVDGIPMHKFDKTYITEDFAYLKAMGLELHLNSEVVFDKGQYFVAHDRKNPIADSKNEHQHVAICVGAGKPREFSKQVTQSLQAVHHKKIIQAVDFLKAANDVAEYLQKNPSLPASKKEIYIAEKFKDMDPRGKKIVVVGGGDTAQDVIRWVSRYFNEKNASQKLNILIRGPEPTDRAILDGYPATSRALTKENKLQAEEVTFVNGDRFYLVEPQQIEADAEGKLTIALKKSKFKAADVIESDSELKAIADTLPREAKPLEKQSEQQTIEAVDMVICALGFEGGDSAPLVSAVKNAHVPHVSFAGDATGVEAQIIVGAQASASKTYSGQIRNQLGVEKQHKPIATIANHDTKASQVSSWYSSIQAKQKTKGISSTEQRSLISSLTW
jgi:glutamate synthase (NADPH) large chain